MLYALTIHNYLLPQRIQTSTNRFIAPLIRIDLVNSNSPRVAHLVDCFQILIVTY
jgi:hypothetical protein